MIKKLFNTDENLLYDGMILSRKQLSEILKEMLPYFESEDKDEYFYLVKSSGFEAFVHDVWNNILNLQV